MNANQIIRHLEDLKKEAEGHFTDDADVQEVRQGKWEEIRDAYGQLEGWMCKECGREMKAKENYCPNCGAKMMQE